MTSYNFLLLLALVIGVAQCQINWSRLTSHQLSQLNPDVFTNITIEQFQSIPPNAFRGWTPDQIRKLPPNVFHHVLPAQLRLFHGDACEAFSLEQMKLPGDLCNNFHSACFTAIPAVSFAGFDSHCLSVLSYQMVDGITPDQFSNLNPSSMIGFSCHQLYGVSASVFPVVSPAQLDGLRSEACCFINHNMHLMKDETLAAMTSSCVENLSYDAFKNITLHQFNLIPTDAIHTIQSSHIVYGNHSLWDHLTVDQLIQLGEPAWSGFAYARQFATLVMKHGKPLVNELTAEQIANVFDGEPSRAAVVKETIYKHFANANTYSWDEVKDELHYVNWIKILMVNEHETNFPHHFTATVLRQMQHLNTMGIRGIIFGKIDAAAFSVFNGRGVASLTADQLGNMTAAQWNALSLQTIGDSNLYGLTVFIPVEVIPHIAPQHFAALAIYMGYSSQWTCPQVHAITEEQVAVFGSYTKNGYEEAMLNCQIIVSPFGQNAPTVNVPVMAAPSGQQNNNGVGVGGVFAIILGCVAGVEAMMIGYYFYRKSRAVQYQAL